MPLRIPAQPQFADPKLLRFAEQVIAALKQVPDEVVQIINAGGFTPARYSGHATAGVSWTSTTWSGVANAATLVDAEQMGITRSGSTWTFAEGGEYVIHFASKAFRTVSAEIGIRARKSGVTVGGPSLSSTESASRMTLARLHKCLSLSAGDVVSLEYAVTSGFASAAAATIDGDAGHTVDIEIYRVR